MGSVPVGIQDMTENVAKKHDLVKTCTEQGLQLYEVTLKQNYSVRLLNIFPVCF